MISLRNGHEDESYGSIKHLARTGGTVLQFINTEIPGCIDRNNRAIELNVAT
jgi:hypothetical protein